MVCGSRTKGTEGQRTSFPSVDDSLLGRGANREILDNRVAQQCASELADPVKRRVVKRAGHLDLEVLALPHRRHLGVAQPAERTENRLTLGVEDFRLQHDVNDDTGHDALRFLTTPWFW